MTDQATSKHGDETALVRLLLVMTVVTGVVDAISILRLGHVFVANMTGNVVFLGFALAGASGFSVPASLVALGAFLVGAAVGGRLFPSPPDRLQLLGRIALGETALCAGATTIAVTAHSDLARYAETVCLALAMGAQNAIVRRLAVADLTTTVLTLTLTGLAADRPDLTEPTSHTRRRLAALAAMLIGAVAGTLLVLHISTAAALVLSVALLALVAIVALPARQVRG
jgi:uncharacterized membrane protein YoaK (UPF0700 family)